MNEEFQTSQESTPELNTPPPTTSKYRQLQKRIIITILLLVVVFGVFRLGYNAGSTGYTFSPKQFKIVNKSGQPVEVDYGLLWETLDVVGKKYINKSEIDQRKVLYGAIRGAVAASGDDYTEFFDPDSYAQFKNDLEGTFSGIGAEISKKDGNIVVVAPLDDSPAQKAGLLPQDVIVKIDDQEVVDWNTNQAASAIRGQEGTSVKLTIYREGRTETFDVTIVRAKIEVKSVKVEYKNVNGKEVAVMKISRFGDDTKKLFDIAVNEMKNHGVSGLVIDLRNNPGGYLNTSVELASDWLEQGQLVVKEYHSEKDVTDYTSSGINRLGSLKTVILLNGGSASASEILSGALKDHNKAILIGEKSFGKGSVQELIPLSQGTAVKVTIAKWITPSGKHLDKDGLVPDIEVKLTEEDSAAKRDPQLDKALEEVVK